MNVDPKRIRQVLMILLCTMTAWFCSKCSQAFRLAPGRSPPEKFLHLNTGFRYAYRNFLPSFHPADLLIAVLCTGAVFLYVYQKRKEMKKLTTHNEHGSARWGTKKDIAPFIDDSFENNIILTATERLTMNNRPKDPKTARNKNVLIIGGSGSGKTRFWLKPNLMQLHSSYVITDPKGYNNIVQSVEG